VEVLQEQLQKERDLKASLESGLMNIQPGHVSTMSAMDSKVSLVKGLITFIFYYDWFFAQDLLAITVIKTRADLEEINLAEADIINLTQKAADLRGQLSRLQPSNSPWCISCKQQLDRKE